MPWTWPELCTHIHIWRSEQKWNICACYAEFWFVSHFFCFCFAILAIDTRMKSVCFTGIHFSAGSLIQRSYILSFNSKHSSFFFSYECFWIHYFYEWKIKNRKSKIKKKIINRNIFQSIRLSMINIMVASRFWSQHHPMEWEKVKIACKYTITWYSI